MNRVVPQGEAIGRRLLGGGAPCLLESPDLVRSCQPHAIRLILLSSRHASNQGSFPPQWLCCPPSDIGTMRPADCLPRSPLKADREARPLTRLAHPCGFVCGADVPRPLPGARGSTAVWSGWFITSSPHAFTQDEGSALSDATCSNCSMIGANSMGSVATRHCW
jgi:hypothetical protein